MNTENLSTLKIHTLSQKQYDRELAAGNIERNAFYLTPDEGKNVYVGTGDMPDDCDFQIDPEGDILEIPTKVSELENDAGFITLDDLPSGGMTPGGSETVLSSLNYVTPQMFGAVGDGVNDDSSAIQAAIDTNQPVMLYGEYVVSKIITGISPYIYGMGATINILQDIDTIFSFTGDVHFSGVNFNCNNYGVKRCIVSSNDDKGNNNVDIQNISIRDVYNLQKSISTTLITVNEASTVHIDNIRIENCHQAGDGEIGNAEGNITCIYVSDYTKHCSIQNITVNEIHNFDSATSQSLFEDSNGIYVRSGVETAETTIKNIYGYNYGKRLIKSQCAGHIIIDGVTAYNNSIECLAAIGVMQYSSTVVGTATISNCTLTNECTDITNAQYLIASDIETTIMNCILKSNIQHFAIYNNYKMTMYNCSSAGGGVHTDGCYVDIYNCQFDIDSEDAFLREYSATENATIKITDCTITCGRTILKHAKLYVDNCWIDWCHIEAYNFVKLTNSTILGSAQVVYIGGAGELVAEDLTLTAKEASTFEYAFDIDTSATVRITNINATGFLYDVRVKQGNVILRGVNMERVYCKGATYFENYPEYVENLPTPSFMTVGAKVILISDNKLYTFTEDGWVSNEVGDSSNININIDQSYDPESENAQSGKAVKEAVSKIVTIEKNTLSHSANYMPDKSEFVYGWISGSSLKFQESTGNMISPFIEIDENLIGKKLTVQRKASGKWERGGYIKSITTFNAIVEPDTNNNYNSSFIVEALSDITNNSADGSYAVYTIPEGAKYIRVAIGNGTVTNNDYQTMFVINDDEGILGEYVANESVSIEGKKELVDDIMVNASNLSEDAMQKIGEVVNSGYVTPQMFGAKADGVTDDTTAIQAMFNDIAGVGKVYFPHGNYLTTAPIIVEQVPDIEMDGVILSNYNGVALTLGRTDTYTMNKTVKLKLHKIGTACEEGSVGVVICAAARNTFYLDYITRFETNVKLLSTTVEDATPGIFFNTFHISDLNYAKYGLYLDGENGWINDNLFIGGSIGKTEDGAAITINHGGSNVFLKQGMEGAGTCVHIISGGTNTFLQSRCEKATYGLVVDDGGNNIMYSNYGKAEFVNNSRYITNGVINPGIHNTCKCPSVVVDKLEEDKFLKCGRSIFPVYCQLINLSTGIIGDKLLADSFQFENGVWKAVNYRPVFTFDTTKNKKFDFAGEQPPLRVVLYNSEGQIALTDENLTQYLLADQTTAPYVASYSYGELSGIVVLNKSFGFEVSDEVTKIDLIYLADDYTSDDLTYFNIHTEYPCYPIRDEIITVPELPSNGYKGAQVIYNNTIYTYDGTSWIGFDGFALAECLHHAVAVDRLEENRFLKCGTKVISTYCQVMNSTSGNIVEEFAEDSLHLENGSWDTTNYCPVFIFDTTQNKKFAFGGLPVVQVNLYDTNGKITLTDENINQYITAAANSIKAVADLYGNGAKLSQVSTFTVSEEVVRIELVYLGDGYDGTIGVTNIEHFDIRTKLPCYPIRDEILTVSAIPSNGYLGAKVIYKGSLYSYDGVEWKLDNYVLTEEDKTEIAQQAASLIDAALLSALGSGVIE